MTNEHRARQADWALRAGGVALWALSWVGISDLIAVERPPAHGPDLLAFCLAIVGFLAASAGAGLVLLGAHIFDQVEVSDRWRRRSASAAGRSHAAERPPFDQWMDERHRQAAAAKFPAASPAPPPGSRAA